MAQNSIALKTTMAARPRISRWSVIVLVTSLIGIYLLLPQIQQLRGSIPVLEHAAIWWIIAGLAMSALSFFAAAYTQYVAGDYIGSFKRITVLQLTGAFINHFLPFNMGSSGLTARYYWTLGKSRIRAVSLSVIPITFGILTHVTAIAIISPLTLSHVTQHYFGSSFILWFFVALILLLAITYLIPPLRRRFMSILREAADSFGSIKLRSQLPGLILGSLALTVILSIALLFSVYAAHAAISIIDAFTIFVTLTVVQNVAPTPGGIGASEAFLVFGLTSVGIILPQAVAATLIFRFVSFWVPIIPGILALRKVGQWGLLSTSEAAVSRH